MANALPTVTSWVSRARGRASAVNNKILSDEHGTPYFPQASQNITMAAVMMRMMKLQTSLEGQCVMNEFCMLLEVAACQRTDSSEDRRLPGASSY
jgi:hypothetical protein